MSSNNFNKISKYKNNTYYLIDSRNIILNNFLKTYKCKKSSSHKKRSARSISNSANNISKSRSKSNKKKDNKNNIFESNTSNIFKKKSNSKNKNINNNNNITNVRNMKPIKNNQKNIVNKFNWKIDSRNKKSLFNSKNFFKSKTKNIIFPNESSLKMSFLGGINHNKNDSKSKEIKNYSNKRNYFK